MSDTRTIARNSLWLIAAPVVLNVLSLAVTAYIARTLGQLDYGRFVFATNFMLMFLPLGDLGLRTLTVRALAERPPDPEALLGKFLAVRGGFTLLAYAALLVAVHLPWYSPEVRLATCVLGASIIPRSLTSVAVDAFEANEQMKYAAYADLAAGASLTVLSVVVLLLGFRLVALCEVYLAGRLLGLLLAGFFLVRHFLVPRLRLDLGFGRRALAQGAHFFYPSFIYGASQKVGVVILGAVAGVARVGVYGAGNDLIDRLTIIPEGLSAAFFPTLIRVFRSSPEEARALFRRFYGYCALIALPIAVGGTLTAPHLIELIYGPAFRESVVIFQILLWWLLLRFFNSFASWALGGVHQEKLPALTVLTATPIFLLVVALTVRLGGATAVAAAAVVQELIGFVMLSLFLRRTFSRRPFEPAVFARIVAACALMATAVWAIQRFVPLGKAVLLLSVPAGAVLFAALAIGLGAVELDELRGLRRALAEKR